MVGDDPGVVVPAGQVRAVYTDYSIIVYQAYAAPIAEPALAAGRFVPPFSRDRMTWIKPSFLWMMYRCGWATKPGAGTAARHRDRRPPRSDGLGSRSASSPSDGWLSGTQGARTREEYERHLKPHVLPYLGDVALFSVNAAKIRTRRTDRLVAGVGRSTVAKTYRISHANCATAVDDDLVRRNPCLARIWHGR